MFMPLDKPHDKRSKSLSQKYSFWIQKSAREFGKKCISLQHDNCKDYNCKCLCHLWNR